jgi:hypothetical protein
MSDAIDKAIANARHDQLVREEQQRGWRFNLRQRARIVQGRRMVQAPTEEQQRMVAAAVGARMNNARAEGIPYDVLMTLEALRQLAEQGNRAAKWLYEQERTRLGIDRPTISTS